MKKSETLEMRVFKAKKLPSIYFATKSDMQNPNYRSAKPGRVKDSHGTYKSGRILAVRNYE